MPRYRIDNATFDHLSAWCERDLRDGERETIKTRILDYLSACDREDAEYSLSHGWPHIRNLVEV